MSIDRLDFDNIGEADLKGLLDSQLPEGQRLDYKRELYGSSDADKLETMKDVSAFANTHGGHLIIGVSESGGIPSAIDGVTIADPDAEIRKIEQRIENGVEPVIQGVRIKAVQLPSGNFCFVIRIPRSWRPPHRVVAQGKNRFYMRNSSAVYEPDVEGLRMLFTAGSDIVQKIRQFKQERLAHIASGEGMRPLQASGRLVLHIIPFASLSSSLQVDLEETHRLADRLRPMGASGRTAKFNFDGFINERGGERNFGYTQVFRNGIIEAVIADMIREHEKLQSGVIPAHHTEKKIFRVLSSYIGVLRDLQVPPPLAVSIALEGVRGSEYIVNPNKYRYDFEDNEFSPIEHDPLFLPECVINAYGSEGEYHQAVKPAIDALWNAAGYSSAQWFTGPEGTWREPRI